MPLAAIDDDARAVRDRRPRRGVRDIGAGLFEARISLSAATVGRDAGQLINMLFGNTSIHDDVVLHDVEFPDELVAAFGGPRHGIDGLRQRVGAGRTRADLLRAQAAGPAAREARRSGAPVRRGRHRLHQGRSRARRPSLFAVRRRGSTAIAARAARHGRARYVPSLSGDLDAMRPQIARARDAGIDTVMVAPMIAGVVEFPPAGRARIPDVAFLAHPGAGRRRAHRAAIPFRQAVPDARRGRGGVSQSRRPVRLFAGDLPGARRRRRATSARRACAPACRFRPAA